MIDKIKENWEKILLILKEEHEVSDVSYRTWLQPLTPYEFKGNTVTIIVPEQEAMEAWDERKRKARVLGEAAATKLLVPMILMMAVVMAIIMIPAFLSFYG